MRRATLPLDRQHKYRAKSVEIDGVRFASKKEGRRYTDLKMLQRGGYIVGLEIHPKFEMCSENGQKVGVYTADFAYWQKVGTEHVLPRKHRLTGMTYFVEDVKSSATRTTAYRLRKRIVEAQYGIEIQEV